MIEYDPNSGEFIYDSSISKMIGGNFDERELWDVLLSDSIVSAEDIMKMQLLVMDMTKEAAHANTSMIISMRTPSSEQHSFRVHASFHHGETSVFDRILLSSGHVHENSRME